MTRKWVLGLATAITLVAVGGMGFAAFTSTATINATATTGSINLAWTPVGTPNVGAGTLILTNTSYTTCTSSVTSSLVTITAGNLAPGDSCTISTTYGLLLSNTGSIPATVAWTFGSDYFLNTTSAACGPGNFSGGDSLPGGTFTVPAFGDIGAYGSLSPINVDIGLNADAGNSCMGVGATLTILEPGVA